MSKLIEALACCSHLTVKWQTETKEGLTHGWWACRDCGALFNPVALVKKHGGEREKECLCLKCGVSPCPIHDAIGKQPAPTGEKSCKSCKYYVAGEGCYKTCNAPVLEAWQPKTTGETHNHADKFGMINAKLHGLLVDRDNINKRLASLESDRGCRLREIGKRMDKLEKGKA